MKGAGYTVGEIAVGLKAAFTGLTSVALATTLKGLSYGINDVGSAVGAAFGNTPDVLAGALKGANYGANDVASYLKAAGFADAAVNTALSTAGYAADEIKGVMGTIFGGSWLPSIPNPSSWWKWPPW
jgi:hypothetical protein